MTPDQFLASFGRFGIELGLDRINQLLQALGNPHTQVPVIQVAGTNGKGSVCAYLAAILQAAGYRVGRYTSPHLVAWQERITIDGEWISDQNLIAALTEVQKVILAETPPTQFEVITAAAWWYFAQQKVDIAVIETGLGGRLDATNVCDRPLAAVITSISMDHWQRLGDTLAAIAYEKAGIIKPHCPVVIAELPLEAIAVMEDKAKECQTEITWVQAAQPTANGAIWQGIEYPLPLLGKHQLSNSALAIATIQTLRLQGWQIPSEAIISGMANTVWQGRLQWVKYHSQDLLLDGAHNLAAAEALRHFVDAQFPHTPRSWVIGTLATKDSAGMLKALLDRSDRLFAVPVPSHQTTDPELLVKLAKPLLETAPQSYPDWQAAVAAAFELEYPVILCGSLYLVGDCLKSLCP